jgi:hypothetical protein
MRRKRRLRLAPEGPAHADVAQLVEHFTRNEGVRGSSPRVGSEKRRESGCGSNRFAEDVLSDRR